MNYNLNKKKRRKRSYGGSIFFLFILIGLGFSVFYFTPRYQYMKKNFSYAAADILYKADVSEEEKYLIEYKPELNAILSSKDYDDRNFNDYLHVAYDLKKSYKNIAKEINELIFINYSPVEIAILINNLEKEEILSVVNEKEKNRELLRYINLEYFEFEKLSLYVSEYESTSNLTYSDIIKRVNMGLNVPFYSTNYPAIIDEENFTTLVNKYYKTSPDYEPANLVSFDGNSVPLDYWHENLDYLEKNTYDAMISLFREANENGIQLAFNSGYRSYQEQEQIFNEFVAQMGEEAALLRAAKPGFSEHHTGLAFDIQISNNSNGCSFGACMAETKEYNWLYTNFHRFGFIVRYQTDNIPITGYQAEPWHLRYVGVENATYLYETGLSLEEFVLLDHGIRK